MLLEDCPSKADRNFAQFVGVPAARLYFVLEEPLNLYAVRGRAAIFDYGANVFSDMGRAFHDYALSSSGKNVATFSRAGALVSKLVTTSATTDVTRAGRIASRSVQPVGRNGLP